MNPQFFNDLFISLLHQSSFVMGVGIVVCLLHIAMGVKFQTFLNCTSSLSRPFKVVMMKNRPPFTNISHVLFFCGYFSKTDFIFFFYLPGTGAPPPGAWMPTTTLPGAATTTQRTSMDTAQIRFSRNPMGVTITMSR